MLTENKIITDDLFAPVSFGGAGGGGDGGSLAAAIAKDAAKACVTVRAMGAVGGSALPVVGPVTGGIICCATGVLGVAVSAAYGAAFDMNRGP